MDHHLYSILAIIVLLAVNAFFVAAEFALVKAKPFRINLMADEGSKSAKLTQKILADLESYLAACQLGITMASLGLGWVGEPVIAALLEPVFHLMHVPEALIHPISFVLGFLIFSSLHIVVGEQVPKTFAIRKAEPVSLWTAYPLRLFYIICYPLNNLLNWSSNAILASFGIEQASHADVLSDAEIRGIINTSEKHGDLDSNKAVMMQNLFEFDNRTVENIMVSRSAADILNLADSWDDNLDIIRKTQHSRFPVFDGATDNPLGCLLVKDLYSAFIDKDNATEPLSLMRSKLRKPLLVPETQPISTLFEAMRRERTHMAFAMDEYGTFSGVVTLEDMLEEIVGEIADELDIDEPNESVAWVNDHWETDGLISMKDLERFLDVDFPEEVDANTITGMFMFQLSRMPLVNDEIEQSGLRFVAKSVTENRVGKVHIFPFEKNEKPENDIVNDDSSSH